MLRDAPDIVLTRPSEDEAADGLLHLLFPFNAWGERVGLPHHEVHFPFVPVCNLVAAVTEAYSESDAVLKRLSQAGDESSQHQACLDEFSRWQRSVPDASARQRGVYPCRTS